MYAELRNSKDLSDLYMYSAVFGGCIDMCFYDGIDYKKAIERACIELSRALAKQTEILIKMEQTRPYTIFLN